MTGLFEPFDLVVSGANYGINIGGDLLYSGTFGAAIVGFQRGLTAFAISSERGVNRGEEQRWDGIADVAERIADWMLRRDGEPLLLNVNVPNRRFAETRRRADRSAGALGEPRSGRARGRAGVRREAGASRRRFSGQVPSADDPETDFAAVFAGQIAISHLLPIGRACEPPPADLDGLVAALAPDSAAATII